jgi:hypothetical protein
MSALESRWRHREQKGPRLAGCARSAGSERGYLPITSPQRTQVLPSNFMNCTDSIGA